VQHLLDEPKARVFERVNGGKVVAGDAARTHAQVAGGRALDGPGGQRRQRGRVAEKVLDPADAKAEMLGVPRRRAQDRQALDLAVDHGGHRIGVIAGRIFEDAVDIPAGLWIAMGER
jgi:hypothetical protein